MSSASYRTYLDRKKVDKERRRIKKLNYLSRHGGKRVTDATKGTTQQEKAQLAFYNKVFGGEEQPENDVPEGRSAGKKRARSEMKQSKPEDAGEAEQKRRPKPKGRAARAARQAEERLENARRAAVEAQEKAAERERKLAKRRRETKLLQRRTKRGQPVMSGMLDTLLDRIQTRDPQLSERFQKRFEEKAGASGVDQAQPQRPTAIAESASRRQQAKAAAERRQNHKLQRHHRLLRHKQRREKGAGKAE